jgi:hypothetical protein
MKKKKIYTPSLRAFYENVGQLQGIELYESTLDTNTGEIVLLTGSILDKSEIDYREVTMSRGIYITVVPDHIDKSDIDDYWFKYSIVVCKSKLIDFLYSAYPALPNIDQ